MPKKSTGIPKSIVADISRLKKQLSSLEKNHSSLSKELRSTMKSHMDMMRKQEQTIAQLGKKAAKKEKRKPSAYNLFLKDKMSQGISMVDAVKSWKEKQGGMSSSSTRTSQEWQQPSQQY